MKISIGRVVNINDVDDGGRIKVRLMPADRYKSDDDLDYAFPLLPKVFFVKPKIDESVLVFNLDDNQNSQRFYIGPIISQPQKLEYDSYVGGATRLLKGGISVPDKALSLEAAADGTFAKDDEIAIYSRKNSDIILSDNDIRIRCGVRRFNENGSNEVEFNKKNPSYLKMRYYPEGIQHGDNKVYNTTNIVSEEINLLSVNGTPYFNLTDRNELIDSKTMEEIISKAHALPYGDVLVDFLKMFLEVFKVHVHPYPGMAPVVDPTAANFYTKYPSNLLENKLLSKHIRIN